MTVEINDSQLCPLCSKNNHCCISQDNSLGECWCSKEIFPNEIFELVPTERIGKACICKNCLEHFKSAWH